MFFSNFCLKLHFLIGAWRSLASVLPWGGRGRLFESGRSDHFKNLHKLLQKVQNKTSKASKGILNLTSRYIQEIAFIVRIGDLLAELAFGKFLCGMVAAGNIPAAKDRYTREQINK